MRLIYEIITNQFILKIKKIGMFNNFMDYEYEPYHKIYVNENSSFGIYLGDVSAALDLDFIRNQPIKVVVTAAAGMDQVSYPNAVVKHIVYPLLDAKTQNISKFFHQFYDLVKRQIITANILVHCAAGISRSATLVISYIMKKNNWTFKRAVKFVRDKRPIVLPNLGFQRQLKEFQISLNISARTSQVQKRCVPESTLSRKNVFSPIMPDILPDIKNLGQTSFFRSKEHERNINIKFDIDQVNSIHRKMQIRTGKSQHASKALNKKATYFNNFKKELVLAKVQSRRNKLLQRSSNSRHMNLSRDNGTFCRQAPSNAKKFSSLSHRGQKKSSEHRLSRNNLKNRHQRNPTLFDDIGRSIVSKLNLNERRFATEKNIRTRGLQRLAQI